MSASQINARKLRSILVARGDSQFMLAAVLNRSPASLCRALGGQMSAEAAVRVRDEIEDVLGLDRGALVPASDPAPAPLASAVRRAVKQRPRH